MIITGPNGCGKSTLLNALRDSGSGQGRTLYVGPHRNSRRQQVRMRFLGQERIEMSSLLSSNSLPGFEGINLPSRERDAWNFDEAQSFLKYSLCQIELDRQSAIAQRFDSTGSVTKDHMPDVWRPLREMTHNLLPHLQFQRIDVSNRDQIQCLWRVHTKDILVDIDDLSSGEKAVIQLFFPLVEHQISQHLAAVRGAQALAVREPVAVLMDEPELHLHPNLQAKVLDYIRALSLGEGVQFVIATHSPSMVEQAVPDELFLLRPAELVNHDENQLIQVATDDARLRLLRDVFGSTSNVTAMRTLLVVEGRAADRGSRRPSDARIYGFLSDRFGQLTIISGGGKDECKALAGTLENLLGRIAPNLKAVALLDRDTSDISPSSSTVAFLPVSMIENLLVDPEVIFAALETVRHKTAFQSSDEVAQALDAILDGLVEHEISRRVKAAIPSSTFRLHDPVAEARQQVEAFTQTLLDQVTPDRIASSQQQARTRVSELKSASKRREFFDGKEVLDKFFKAHVHQAGMSKEIFVYTCAKHASARQSVSAFVEALFAALGVTAGVPTT
jgi:hypothetical protein